MEENEELEQAGNKVTDGEENNETQHPKQAPEQNDVSLPSDGPVSETEGDDSKPDLNDIKKNPDQEPGVPDDDF